MVGDIFDKPNPDQKVKDQLLRQLTKSLSINSDLHFIFIAGNHDYTTKAKEYHSLQYLHILRDLINSVVPDRCTIHVVEPGEYKNFYKEFDLYVMPAWNNFDFTTIRKTRTNVPLVLAWHGLVPGLDFADITTTPKSVIKSIHTLLQKTGASYIALGDIHRCMRLTEKCWYPGPPIQKTYADEPGVLIVNIDHENTSVSKYQLKLPRKVTLTVSFEEGKDSEDLVIEKIKEEIPAGNLVKLQFKLPLSLWSSLDKKYMEKELKDHCFELKLENDPIPEYRTRKAVEKVSKAKNLLEELSIILEEGDFGLDIEKLKETCLNYL